MSKNHIVTIKNIRNITYDVKEYTTSKPTGYKFNPGQATEVAINDPEWKGKKRPFTFTSLPEDEDLQFTVKSYSSHDGVTDRMDNLEPGEELMIGDAWGAINFKGKGVFIAGGAGITPFLSIFKDLEKKGELEGNYLLFSNKTGKDVIHEAYFQEILGENFISTLTREKVDGHEEGRIDMDFLKKHILDFSQHFYVCGPMKMVIELSEILQHLGANTDNLVFEK